MCTFAININNYNNVYMCNMDNKKIVTIKCNSEVKKFTIDRLQKLGIDVGLGYSLIVFPWGALVLGQIQIKLAKSYIYTEFL